MKNKTHQKRVAAIHDLSGFGKCSLTVALPILSAAGIETSALPTAILSTHTGGISGYTYHDGHETLEVARHKVRCHLHRLPRFVRTTRHR